MSLNQRLGTVAIALLMTGCYASNEGQPIPLFPIGGNGSGTVPKPQTSPMVPVHPITEDPESSSDWFDYVWGETEAEAIRNCQKLADRERVNYVRVKRSSKNSKRWECHVRG